MLTENLAVLFERDLLKLKTEISAYPNEKDLWKPAPGTSNPGGNLCLHLLGNLQHFIGAHLGHSGYVRNRPLEFSQKDIPAVELIDMINHTSVIVVKTLRSLSNEELAKEEYPEKVFEEAMTTEFFLLHLLSHLDYHLGQINFHRRIISSI